MTYRKNPSADFTPTVDDIRIFDFIDTIAAGHEDNWLRLFDNVADIEEALRAQFAYILLLYSQSLRKTVKAPAAGIMVVEFPSSLDGAPGESEAERAIFITGLRQVYDTLKALLAADIRDSIKSEQMKSIWVIARHGEGDERRIKMREDRFKASAWSRHRGQRVFAQMTDCGICGEYDFEEDNMGRAYGTVEISFDMKERDADPAYALKEWISALVKRYGDDDALDFFKRLDMRAFVEAPKPKKASKAKAA